jgi:transcription antitermination protein NusB
MTANPQPSGQPPRPRSIARTAAVQALYQMDMAGTDLNQVIGEFQRVRFAPDVMLAGDAIDPRFAVDPEERAEGADAQFFADILRGVVRRQRDIDPMIDIQLAEGWRLVRVDSILRAILRAGTFELLERSDVPARVVINEYINVAHAFLSGDDPKVINEYINVAHSFFDVEEPRVVNGVLDRIARKVRGQDIPAGPKKSEKPDSKP